MTQSRTIVIINRNSQWKTYFQKDCKKFLIQYNFDTMFDEDGELVVDTFNKEIMCIREFREGTNTSNDWVMLQNRYDKGER